MRYSPGGQLLATAGINGEIRLWNTQTGELRAVLMGHFDLVMHLAFTPDGRTLVSGGNDHNVKVWDISRFTPRPGGTR